MPDITLDQLKKYIGIQATDTSRDDKLTALANASNAAVRKYTGRDFQCIPRNENYQGNGKDTLVLRHSPVTVFTSMTVDGVTMVLTNNQSVPPLVGNIDIDYQQGIIYRVDGAFFGPVTQWGVYGYFNQRFPTSPRYLINVQYTGGVDVVPDDIHYATLELGSIWWNKQGGQVATTAGGLSIRLDPKAIDDMPTVAPILDSYRDPAKGYLS